MTTARRITHDIEVNRALALALEILRRVLLPEEIARRLAALGSSFARVERTPMSPDEVARIALDRLTARYRTALGLAELVLRSQQVAPRAGERAGASMLFHMPRVWEAYVVRWVGERWGDGFQVEAPHTFALTDDGRIRSEADVTVWRDGRLVALYDAKYKWADRGPSTGDIYQMITYCQKLRLGEASLVYPGPFPEQVFTVNRITVRTVGLPVMCFPDG